CSSRGPSRMPNVAEARGEFNQKSGGWTGPRLCRRPTAEASCSQRCKACCFASRKTLRLVSDTAAVRSYRLAPGGREQSPVAGPEGVNSGCYYSSFLLRSKALQITV